VHVIIVLPFSDKLFPVKEYAGLPQV